MSEIEETNNEAEAQVELYDTPAMPQELNTKKRSGGEVNLEMIMNVPVDLSIEIGQTDISIGELLELAPGSVVELERRVGEPHDVLVNGSLIAHGEIVVVKDHFGIRFTDVVSLAERVKGLRE